MVTRVRSLHCALHNLFLLNMHHGTLGFARTIYSLAISFPALFPPMYIDHLLFEFYVCHFPHLALLIQ